jgi:hypothetical protein
MLNWMIVVNLTRILASSLLFIIATEHKYINLLGYMTNLKKVTI